MSNRFNPGDAVCFISKHGGFENGIVKSYGHLIGTVFVVYNCSGDWHNYENYTAALTPEDSLVSGWR